MARRTDGPFWSEFRDPNPRLDQGQATPLKPSLVPAAGRLKSRALPLAGALLVLLLSACGGSDDSSSSPLDAAKANEQTQAAATPIATQPATAQVPPQTLEVRRPPASPIPREPDGQRILADVRHLAEAIGPRPASSPTEKAAAEWLAERLRGLGYEVTLQEFAASTEASRTSTLATTGRVIASAPFEGSGATNELKGPLVAAGIGRPNDFPANASGSIVLVERGELLFDQKVRNALTAGAKGVIIYNHEQGINYGALSFASSIPVVAISRTEGQKLVDELSRGPLQIEMTVSEVGKGISRNVVAKPPGKDCATVSGGHYDSVQVAPGANDNASGTATVLEIAAVLSSKGDLGSHCFVLFGAEEPGLIGSRAYVASLDTAARQKLKAMLNFDMTGFGDVGWIFIGSSELQTRALAQAQALGITQVRSGGLPRNSSSDHASFIAAGIPSLFYYRSEDRLLHTPQDTAERLNPKFMEDAARMGVAMLESFNGT